MDSLTQYNDAVKAIKTAILQGQYEAAKGVNRIQLALYFAIGKVFGTTHSQRCMGRRSLSCYQRTTSQGTSWTPRFLRNTVERHETLL